MPFTKEKRRHFETLRKRYGIEFIDELQREKWPDSHKEVFEAVEKIKAFEYEAYALEETVVLAAAPWKQDAKNQALKLIERAKVCVGRNECTWRLACEPVVFNRFAAEIACKTCRKRVWRSEVEVTSNAEDRGARHLRDRQSIRQPCMCPRHSRQDDRDERVGLNKLFIDRAEESIIHPPQLAAELGHDQQPDHIYGLRQTRNLEDLLYTKLPGETIVQDCLQQQPVWNSGSGESLLFPFLVIEAKSGTAQEDWHSIRLQTVFPIYTFLNVQQSLKSATGAHSRWGSGPLVWFFMNRGEDWRVCVAYQSQNHPLGNADHNSYITHVVQIWHGCITLRRDALQLFLLVDYIADWARDIFRPSVLTELRILAKVNTDVSSILSDTDIYSAAYLSAPTVLSTTEVDAKIEDSISENTTDFKSLDSDWGVTRHISPIKSGFLALYITVDNIQTFLLSIKQSDRAFFARKILNQLNSKSHEVALLSAKQLNAMEKQWTGYHRLRPSFSLLNTAFYTVYRVSYYLSPSWEQIRDLSVIAIATDTFQTFVDISGLIPQHGKARLPVGYTEEHMDVVSELAALHGSSAQQNLLAAISRTTGYVANIDHPGQRSETDDENLQQLRSPLPFPRLKTGDAAIWELVNFIYKSHRMGDLEPEQAFLRVSKRQEHQAFRRHTSDKFHPDLLQISKSGGILLRSKHQNYRLEGRGCPSPICLYVVGNLTHPPNRSELADIIRKTYEDYDIYHTSRDNRVLHPRTNRQERALWNLEKPYGVDLSPSNDFPKWLEKWNAPRPLRQGHPMGGYDSGRIIFQRNFYPWCDPRRNAGSGKRKALSEEIKAIVQSTVRFWNIIARIRKRMGLSCCICCSRLVQCRDFQRTQETCTLHRFCSDCGKSLDSDSQFGKLVTNAIQMALAEPLDVGIEWARSERGPYNAIPLQPSAPQMKRVGDIISDEPGSNISQKRKRLSIKEEPIE